MIAWVEAYRSGLLARNQWLPNLVAGVVVGVVALPLAMAFAIASGARPEQGLYTAIIGGACVSVFGGSRLQIARPTGAVVAILCGRPQNGGTHPLYTAPRHRRIHRLHLLHHFCGPVARLSGSAAHGRRPFS